MSVDLTKLRELAQKATPLDPEHRLFSDGDWSAYAEENADFIAAFNPKTALELFDELEEARRVCEWLEGRVKIEGGEIPGRLIQAWKRAREALLLPDGVE